MAESMFIHALYHHNGILGKESLTSLKNMYTVYAHLNICLPYAFCHLLTIYGSLLFSSRIVSSINQFQETLERWCFVECLESALQKPAVAALNDLVASPDRDLFHKKLLECKSPYLPLCDEMITISPVVKKD